MSAEESAPTPARALGKLHYLGHFLRARLSPEGALGVHLTVGAAVLVLAGWMFGDLAEDVATHDRITVVDLEIANALHAFATPTLTQIMLVASTLHDVLAMSIATLALAVYFAVRRYGYWLLTLLLAVPGGMGINIATKLSFRRARPVFEDPLVTLASYSFPSGHVAGSTLFYGVLAAFLVAQTRSTARQFAIATVALLLIAFVASSRMYLGAHYMSDVIGAFAESIAWLALCITAVNVFSRRRGGRLGRVG